MGSIRIDLTPDRCGYWFVINRGQILLTNDSDPVVPFGVWSALALPAASSAIQLAEFDGHPCYLVIDDDQRAETSQWQSVRSLLSDEDPFWFLTAARATQLALFLQTHRYCGQCGHAMQEVDWELATHCHRCQHRCYPRISPCVLVAVRRPGEILLARSARHKAGLYSIVAGFVESGETLEQAAIREVLEETGIQITNLRYMGSQPWPFPHSLMAGFIADYVAGDIVCQPNEIEDAAWFSVHKLPQIPPLATLSGQMIAAVVAQESSY
jgi:NAD+ diphosphatase